MEISKLIDDVAYWTAMSKVDIENVDPKSKPAFGIKKSQAQSMLPQLRAKYGELIEKKIVPVFAKSAVDQNMHFDADVFYDDMAKSVFSFAGWRFSPSDAGLCLRFLHDTAVALKIDTYDRIDFSHLIAESFQATDLSKKLKAIFVKNNATFFAEQYFKKSVLDKMFEKRYVPGASTVQVLVSNVAPNEYEKFSRLFSGNYTLEANISTKPTEERPISGHKANQGKKNGKQ
jgi:hypothetical protein